MSTRKDHTGMRFGRLVAKSYVRPGNGGKAVWLFVCDCGAEKEIYVANVKKGMTRSCGCLFHERFTHVTHGLSRHHPREYRSWMEMRQRCGNPNNKNYFRYGGRGISVCKRWDDFATFFSDMGGCPPAHTIDRIDVNGHYDPGNCRWATAEAQANNRRSNRVIEMRGEAMTVADWCRRLGANYRKVHAKLMRGLSPELAFECGGTS